MIIRICVNYSHSVYLIQREVARVAFLSIWPFCLSGRQLINTRLSVWTPGSFKKLHIRIGACNGMRVFILLNPGRILDVLWILDENDDSCQERVVRNWFRCDAFTLISAWNMTLKLYSPSSEKDAYPWVQMLPTRRTTSPFADYRANWKEWSGNS